jgi:hypothetical protein
MNIEAILKDKDFRSNFGIRLHNNFTINEGKRRSKELEWIEDIRQIRGLYDPGVILDKNRSKVYPKMTRKYCNMVLSRLHEMLFPDTDRNFDMEPTPDPKLAKTVVKEIATALAMSKGGGPFSDDELFVAIQKWCKETNDRMRRVIDDQLAEIHYTLEAKKVLRSGVDFGTGVLKGPLTNKSSKRRWKQTDGGDFEEDVKDVRVPYLGHVRIWDWYPDMSVTELRESTGSYERHVMNRHDLINLAMREDFDTAYIKEYIADHVNGDCTWKGWEQDLQSIEAEAGAQEASNGLVPAASSGVSGGTIDRDKRYEVFEYWGLLDAVDLNQVGITVDDPSATYEIQAWFLGNKIIMADVAPGASSIYKVFYYEKDDTSIYGEGLPRVMRHSQMAIGGGCRMVLDNGAVVAGPNTEINTSLLTPGQDITENHPMKIWYREGRGVEGQWPAVRAVQFDSHIPELLTIISLFREIADEETCLPTWMISSPVKTNETAGGASMRFGMLTMSVKDIVRNFDSFTENVIGGVYHWNMDNNEDPNIKGDYKVVPKGVSSLVGKEVRMQAMSQFKTTLTDEDWIYIPRRDFLEEFVRTHDLPIRLRTEEEAREYVKSITDPEIDYLVKEEKRADIAYRKAQAAGALAKGKKVNVDAVKSEQGLDKEPPSPLEQENLAADAMLKRAKATKEYAQAKQVGKEKKPDGKKPSSGR